MISKTDEGHERPPPAKASLNHERPADHDQATRQQAPATTRRHQTETRRQHERPRPRRSRRTANAKHDGEAQHAGTPKNQNEEPTTTSDGQHEDAATNEQQQNATGKQNARPATRRNAKTQKHARQTRQTPPNENAGTTSPTQQRRRGQIACTDETSERKGATRGLTGLPLAFRAVFGGIMIRPARRQIPKFIIGGFGGIPPAPKSSFASGQLKNPRIKSRAFVRFVCVDKTLFCYPPGRFFCSVRLEDVTLVMFAVVHVADCPAVC